MSILGQLESHCLQEVLCDCIRPGKSVLLRNSRICHTFPPSSPSSHRIVTCQEQTWFVCQAGLEAHEHRDQVYLLHCLLSTQHSSWHIEVLKKYLWRLTQYQWPPRRSPSRNAGIRSSGLRAWELPSLPAQVQTKALPDCSPWQELLRRRQSITWSPDRFHPTPFSFRNGRSKERAVACSAGRHQPFTEASALALTAGGETMSCEPRTLGQRG